MTKLLALISSVSVCASAVAVSVLSYFPSVKADASAPDTSSLIVTSLYGNSSPLISFPLESLRSATSDVLAQVSFSPTGWTSSDISFVSPSSYGTYSPSLGSFVFSFTYSTSGYFNLRVTSDFPSSDGLKVFTSLFLTSNNDYDGYGFGDRHLNFSATSYPNYSFVNLFSLNGSHFDPSLADNDVIFSLRGTVGNDYALWLSFQGYNTGYRDGSGDGYVEGHDDGYSDGHTDGYNEGYADGNSSGYAGGHDNGYLEGHTDGYNDGHGDGYREGYTTGNNDGKAVGYNEGHADGYNQGVSEAGSNFGMWDLFSNAFGSIGNILSIQLFPGLSVGLLLSVPIAFAFILWLIHVLKG